MEERTSGRFGGQLSAVLFLLCGGLLAVAVPLVPLPPSANRGVLLGLAGVTLASGVVIWLLPWDRWPRSSTLALIPPTLVLIGIYNYFGGADGYRYATVLLHHVRLDRNGSPERHVGEGGAARGRGVPPPAGDRRPLELDCRVVGRVRACRPASCSAKPRRGSRIVSVERNTRYAIRKRASASSSWRTRSRCGSSTWKTCTSSR